MAGTDTWGGAATTTTTPAITINAGGTLNISGQEMLFGQTTTATLNVTVDLVFKTARSPLDGRGVLRESNQRWFLFDTAPNRRFLYHFRGGGPQASGDP